MRGARGRSPAKAGPLIDTAGPQLRYWRTTSPAAALRDGTARQRRLGACCCSPIRRAYRRRLADVEVYQGSADAANGAILVAAMVSMQTRVWKGVLPEAMYHITRAFSRVGLNNYARMIAAEAITRL